MKTTSQNGILGLALSGGGSRAAAFHCGTILALDKVGILAEVDVVSTVSGGSILGAAWVVSCLRQVSTTKFIEKTIDEIERGFIRRLFAKWRLYLPWGCRSMALASVFNDIFFRDIALDNLPRKPLLCINVTVMNNGQVGKFSRNGFQCTGLAKSSENLGGKDIPLSKAVMASAGYPLFLPPILFKRSALLSTERTGAKRTLKHDYIALTDGGVLENLGLQTLLKSRTFSANNIVSSDAGTRHKDWNPSSILSFIQRNIPIVSTIQRLNRSVAIMGDKQNRHMRHQLFLEKELFSARANRNETVEHNSSDSMGLDKILMVRINQTFERLLLNIPRNVIVSYAQMSGTPLPTSNSVEAITEFLLKALPKTKKALFMEACDVFDNLGVAGIERCNQVPTRFNALSRNTINDLINHSYWQTLICFALYW